MWNILKQVERQYFGLKGKWDFLAVVKNPNDTQRIFRMNAALKRATPSEEIERFMQNAYRDPRLEAQFQRKYWPSLPPLEKMNELPSGSLGRELALFFRRWNLDPYLFPHTGISTRSDYLLSRVYQAHDIWHLLTGYEPVLEDEMALQAFGLGQYGQPLSMLIATGGILHVLNKQPEKAPLVMGLMAEGFSRGQAAKNLLIEPIFERVADPLEEVRRDLGIIPRSSGRVGLSA